VIDYPEPSTELDIPGVPEDTKYLADRLDQQTGYLREIRDATIEREIQRPSRYQCLPGRNDFPQQPRVSLKTFVVSVSAACSVTVRIGAAVDTVLDFPAAAAQEFSFPVVVDAGTDVTVLASAGTLRAAYFTGTPDE